MQGTKNKVFDYGFFQIFKKSLMENVIFRAVMFQVETLAQVFSCEFCEISKTTFFTEDLWRAASIHKNYELNLCFLSKNNPLSSFKTSFKFDKNSEFSKKKNYDTKCLRFSEYFNFN